MVFHVEVNFGALPVVIDFVEQRRDQAQERSLVGEEAGEAGAAFKFQVDPLQGVAGAEAALVAWRQAKDRQALREVVLHPQGQLGDALGVELDDFFKPALGRGAIRAVEDRADGLSDLGALVEPGNVSLGVLLEMELAALPGDGGKDGGAGGAQAGMVVADDEADAREAALQEALKEGAPVGFGFAQGGADAQDGAFALGIDAQGDEDGAVQELALMANLFIAGIEHEVWKGPQRAGSPGLELSVELGRALADLGGADRRAAELLDDGGDFAGGDALDIHFGQGQFKRLFAADAFSKALG